MDNKSQQDQTSQNSDDGTTPLVIDSSQQNTFNPKPSNFKKLIDFFNNTEPSVSWIAGILSLIGAIWLTKIYIETNVNKIFLENFAPYENLQTGKALIDDFEYDEAIPELEVAFKKLGKRFHTEDARGGKYYIIVDYYLYAIVNSKYPDFHEHRFKQLLKIGEENKISFTAWHYHQFAWYYLRTGFIKEAETNFLLSLDKYKSYGSLSTASDTFWGLTLLYLCKGDLNSALKNYNEASTRSSSYSYESVLTTINHMNDEPWYDKLIDLYDIESHLPKFKAQIQKVKSSGTIIRGSDAKFGTGYSK